MKIRLAVTLRTRDVSPFIDDSAPQPSVQKLVSNIAKDCLGQAQEESVSTDAYVCDTSRVDQAVDDLQSEFSEGFVDPKLVSEFIAKTQVRRQSRESAYQQTVSRLCSMGTTDSSSVSLRFPLFWRSRCDLPLTYAILGYSCNPCN